MATMPLLPPLGKMTGPNPTDRAKSGTKRSVHTDGGGIPSGLVVAGANRPDLTLLADTLAATVIERPVPTAAESQHLCLDGGYDTAPCRQTVQDAGYIAHIRSRKDERATKQAEPGYKPRRWVVERVLSWINRFRKLLVRFEQLTGTHYALLCFACAYIAFKRADLI